MNKALILALSLLIAGNIQANDTPTMSHRIKTTAQEIAAIMIGVTAGFTTPMVLSAMIPDYMVNWVQNTCKFAKQKTAVKTCISAAAVAVWLNVVVLCHLADKSATKPGKLLESFLYSTTSGSFLAIEFAWSEM